MARRILLLVLIVVFGSWARSNWVADPPLDWPVKPVAMGLASVPDPPAAQAVVETTVNVSGPMPIVEPPAVVAAAMPNMPAPPIVTAPSVAMPRVVAPKLGLAGVDYDERGAIRFTGTAEPGSVVRAGIEAVPLGEVAADAGGRWSLTPETIFAAGAHRLRLEQLDMARNASVPVDVSFIRAPPGAMAVPGGHIVVQPADELWGIARTAYGHGELYTLIYNANRSQIRDPKLIYPGQVLTIPNPMPSPSSTSR